MAIEHLEALMPVLMAIPAADVERPARPVMQLVDSANGTVAWLRKPGRVAEMRGLRLPDDVDTAVERAVSALMTAQSRWQGAKYDEAAGSNGETLLDQAHGEFQRLLGIAGHFFKAANVGLASLGRVRREGDEVDASDFELLAFTLRRFPEVFREGDRFSAESLAAEADAWAARLMKDASTPKADASGPAAKDLRDRAYTYLKGLVADVRSAAEVAFGARSPAIAELRAIA